jgi:A/G-specific adenine glycosylase
VTGREPLLRLRHSITNTNYYVQVFAAMGPRDRKMRRALLVDSESLDWFRTSRLQEQPLTGLARKALRRLTVMEVPQVRIEGMESMATPIEQIEDTGLDSDADSDFDDMDDMLDVEVEDLI